MNKSTAITILVLLAFFLLSGCDVIKNIILPASTLAPTQTAIPTATPTLTTTPTITPTFTSTPTPTPTPIGGAYIQFMGLNTAAGGTYCGLMTLDGQIVQQEKSLIVLQSNQSLLMGLKIRSKFCPYLDSVTQDWPKWSPDHTQYVLYDIDVSLNESASETNLFLGKFNQSTHELLGTYPLYRSNSGYLIAPRLSWLGNQRLLLRSIDITTKQEQYRIYDISNKSDRLIGSYGMVDNYPTSSSASPDNRKLVIQSWTGKLSDYFLVNIEDGQKANVTEGITKDYGITFPFIVEPRWSPDGSKFAIFGKKDNDKIWLIIDQDGEMVSVLNGGPQTPLEGWATWNPDNESLLIRCNDKNNGLYDLCLLNMHGDFERSFPAQKFWRVNYWSQWSEDGKFLYYLLSQKGYGSSAKIFRLNLSDGSNELIVDEIIDRTWIQSDEIREFYNLSALWSPDANWFIVNDAGPDFSVESGVRSETFATVLLCNANNICEQFTSGSFVILGAQWWDRP